jgi:hypothetical protein
MSDDNKAIKVSTSGSLYNGEYVTLYPSDSRFDMRFPGMPTELTYKLPEGMEFGYSLYYEYTKAHDEVLMDISRKHGGEVMKAARKAMSSLMFPRSKDNDETIDTEIKEELTEIIQHLTTLLKAKMLEYVHAKHADEVQRMEANTEKAKQFLQQVLEDGPEVLKNVANEDD